MESGDIIAIVISLAGMATLMTIILVWIHNRNEYRKMQLVELSALPENDRLRALISQVTASQEAVAAELQTLRTTSTEVEKRLATIEQMMRDVG